MQLLCYIRYSSFVNIVDHDFVRLLSWASPEGISPSLSDAAIIAPSTYNIIRYFCLRIRKTSIWLPKLSDHSIWLIFKYGGKLTLDCWRFSSKSFTRRSTKNGICIFLGSFCSFLCDKLRFYSFFLNFQK